MSCQRVSKKTSIVSKKDASHKNQSPITNTSERSLGSGPERFLFFGFPFEFGGDIKNFFGARPGNG